MTLRSLLPLALLSLARPAPAATPASAAAPAKKAGPPKAKVEEGTPPPADGDPDRERVLRLQETLSNIVHGPVLGRLRVGMRVVDLSSGRLLFGRRGTALMDPASNQKVLATA